jgi:hypothetical protein
MHENEEKVSVNIINSNLFSHFFLGWHLHFETLMNEMQFNCQGIKGDR